MAVRGRTQSTYVQITVLLLVMAGKCLVDGFRGGAPDSVCWSLMVSHDDAGPQTSAPPYRITTSSTIYTARQNLTVTLSATDGNNFSGFLLVARDSSQNRVGTISESSNDIRTACQNTGATNTNGNSKTTVTVTWTAPATAGTGSVRFVATVVKSFRQFWMNVESAAITEWRNTPSPGQRTTPPSSPGIISSASSFATPEISPGIRRSTASYATPGISPGIRRTPSSLARDRTTPSGDVDTSECDKTKSCFRVPDGCTSNCDYILTWRNADQAISFEMSSASSSNYWVAFGLSLDQKMGDDDVVDCIFNDQTGTITIQASRNVGQINQVLSDPTLGFVPGTLSGSFVNGRITCRFQRLRNVRQSSGERRRSARQTGSDTLLSLDDDSYYLLLAKGVTNGGEKQWHSNRIFSATRINITSASMGATAADESVKSILIKIHGCLMLIAWMVFASFGTLMPRYCKTAWQDKTWCGKKIWFQIHQSFMAITLILTASAFVIVFAAVQGYSQLPSPTFAHPPLGIAVMALVIVNPIMALFRPEPNAKNRPVFNFFHFSVGLISHLASVVTMFLGLYMPQLTQPLWCIIVMSAYIGFHAVIEIVLAVHMHADKCCRSTKHNKKDMEMERYDNEADNVQSSSSQQPTNAPSSKFKTTVLAVHLLGVVGCCAAIVVQTVLS